MSYSPETLNSGQNWWFIVPRDLEIWWTTLKSNRAPLLYYIKRCASFESHGWIQSGVTVRKCSIRVDIGNFLSRVTLKFDNWPWKTIAHLSYHGGTTEEGNCSYLLPRAAAVGSNGTNKGQIRKGRVDKIVRFLVYSMDVTISLLSANTGILMCLVREKWQFKVFTGKEVTPRHEEGNS